MNSVVVIASLLSAGAATIIVALLNALFNRRKLSAEATQIITQAAAGTVENVMRDNAELRTRMGKLDERLAHLDAALELAERRERSHQADEERWRWHMERWHRYCGRLLAELRAAGVSQIEDPPPSWPERTNIRP